MNTRHPKFLGCHLPTLAILLSALLLGGVLHARASMVDELPEADRAKLERGDDVLITREIEGGVWPEVSIYRKVKATPQGVTELFLDYEHANTFIANLKSAVVESEPDANTKDVRYTVKLPVLFTISYLVRNSYEKTPEGYTVHWKLLESIFAKSAVGRLRVEPHGDLAVICYANHVEPATQLVAGLRNLAIKEASKTVDAIVKEAERRHAAGGSAPDAAKP
ncbi:MAG: hypothetical protein JHC52_06280 [Chthoniobacterales bacterium]|nr:hypothetical protein [Chthoniobacterales bacterium]